jgi:hypothetical protein
MANTVGEKELRKSWDEYTQDNPDKPIGYNYALEPEESKVLSGRRKGM